MVIILKGEVSYFYVMELNSLKVVGKMVSSFMDVTYNSYNTLLTMAMSRIIRDMAMASSLLQVAPSMTVSGSRISNMAMASSLCQMAASMTVSGLRVIDMAMASSLRQMARRTKVSLSQI